MLDGTPRRSVSFFLRGVLSLCGLLLALGAVSAAAVTYGDIEVRIDSEPRANPSHGYTEYRFVIVNRGDQSRRIKLEIPATTFGNSGAGQIRSISRSAEVGANKVITLSLFQPDSPPIMGNGVEVSIDGRAQEGTLALSPVNGRHSSRRGYSRGMFRMIGSSSSTEYTVFSSQRVGEKFFAPITPHSAGWGRGGPGGAIHLPVPGGPPVPAGGMGGGAPMVKAPVLTFNGEFFRADSPISTWSDRWLGYTSYDLITVTSEDLDELARGTPEIQAILNSLWQYVETGGSLFVLGPAKIPLSPIWQKSGFTQEGMTIYRVGFGMCIVSPDRDSDRWNADRWQVVTSAASGTGMPWRSSRGLLDLNLQFPVVDDLALPVRGLFTLLIFFGIAIGPVNLVVLNRKNKRIWLLWTVPLLSCIFCIAVLGYMIAAEGWHGHSRLAGITLLDEGARRATTLGKTAFYTPMTPGDGLHFSESTEIQIQGNEHPAYSNNCAIDWTGGQHLTRGWVIARVPSHFTMRKSESRLERLTLREESDGSKMVVNALGVDLRSLTLMDHQGQLYRTGAIPAGATAKLTPGGKMDRTSLPMDFYRRTYTATDWSAAIDKAVENPDEWLGPGSYVAVVEETPFLEQGFPGSRVRKCPSLVIALMADPGRKP